MINVICVAIHLVLLKMLTARCALKHKCPHMRQIPKVAIIIKTQDQDVKI
jgi:hypothetical protein